MDKKTKIETGPNLVEDPLYKDEVFKIIGAAYETQKTLGPGFLAAVYQEAFEYELAAQEVPFVSRQNLQIHYKNSVLKNTYTADLVAYDKIIIQIKAMESLTLKEEAELMNCLRATGIRLGLLLNFGTKKLEWKRSSLTLKYSLENSEKLG